jgi:quercetin dioxygenase-like cupin family protein
VEIQRIDESQGEPPADLAEHFQGVVRMQHVAPPVPDAPAVFSVHFEAGGRTRPHRHLAGQVLTITSGHGVVGVESGRRLVEAGDVVVASPGEWHWHGATPFAPMSHLVVQMGGPDSVDWDVEERDWGGDCEG